MSNFSDIIIAEIKALESELEATLAEQRAGMKFGLENGKASFEKEVIRRHVAFQEIP